MPMTLDVGGRTPHSLPVEANTMLLRDKHSHMKGYLPHAPQLREGKDE